MQTHRRFSWILVFAAIIMVFSSILLVWIFLPVGFVTHEILIDPFVFEPSGEPQNSYYYPVLNTLIFSWPEKVKLGGQSEITLNVDGEEITPEAGVTEEYRKITEDYHIVFEARLDLSFSSIWPVEEIKKPVNSLRDTDFEWRINLNNSLDHSGNLWVYINFVPKNGGDTIRRAISAVPVTVETTSLFGISIKILRWIIAAGYFFAFALIGFSFNGAKNSKNK